MATITTLWWRDIPAQVIAGTSRRNKVKHILNERFEKAIDRAAMRGGAKDTNDYLSEWHKTEEQSTIDDLSEAVKNRAEDLEATYHDELLKQLVANGGWEQK